VQGSKAAPGFKPAAPPLYPAELRDRLALFTRQLHSAPLRPGQHLGSLFGPMPPSLLRSQIMNRGDFRGHCQMLTGGALLMWKPLLDAAHYSAPTYHESDGFDPYRNSLDTDTQREVEG
jgi:hypothetical protein